MMQRIYLSAPHMSAAGYEKAYIEEAFASNWIAPLGKNVDEFEAEVAVKVGANTSVALSSGTAALHLALVAAGVQTNDIVLCQSLTFAASANPIIYQGAVPVFVDSNIQTWNICPMALEEALQKYPQTKAVIVVHLYGLVADMDKIAALCKHYNVTLIEDAAESLGSTYHSKYTGTFGDYGVFSYNGNKIITASSGGSLIPKDPSKAAKIRFWATQARDQARHYEHSELGFNYRMSNIVAGIARGQLQVLEERISQKKYIFEFYRQELSHLTGLEFMPIIEHSSPNYWLSCITIAGKIRPLDIICELEADNVESRPLWKPMHLQPFFKGYDYIGGNTAAKLFENGLCLPSDTKMTEEELQRVCNLIKKWWK